MCLILILNCCLFSFVFVSFSTKTFTFRKFIYGCLFGGRLGFSPRWGPLSFSPSQFVQFSCAHCGDSRGSECPWATLWLSSSCTKIVFWGLSEFQPKLSLLLSPHQHISIFKNQAPSKVKCHRTAFCRDQTVTERPVRPRVSAPAIVEILAYVFMCHTPVTLIKSTYLLTYWTRCAGFMDASWVPLGITNDDLGTS